jgi:nucleoside-diphosphate-sugar epimerase
MGDRTEREVVLVTGYPSLLARAVCAEVTRQDERAEVRALVTAPQLDDARAALLALSAEQRGRVELVEGDASAIDMGLASSELKALWREVTRIHHCAELTHFGAERIAAEQINVGGAQEAVEFASHCPGLDCLVLHSRAHVSGDRTGTVLEQELEAGQAFRNVVEETKARGEKVVRAAMGRIPAAVVRPTTVVGDSVTGEVERLDGLYPLILLVVSGPPDLALPLPARGEELLNLVPVDWVAKAAVAIGRDPRAAGRTFHLTDRRPLTVRRVFDLVARAGGRPPARGSIPTNLAKALLSMPGLDRIGRSPRAFLDMLTTHVTYDCRGADELLGALGIGPCPTFESYGGKLVDWVKGRGSARGSVGRNPAAAFESERP